MLSINSNINSLVAQENLTNSGSALTQAITRLSSGKRINSAADDAAGLAISNIMQTQVNGLNQGVSNANDGVSMVQTASSGLSSLTNSLQTIRQLAVEASDGSMTNSDRAALQQEVAQQVQEVNRIASQTTYNGLNVLNGSLGNVSFQVGANVGQTISINLSQDVAASSLGGGAVQSGDVIASLNVSLDSSGAAWKQGTSTGTEITQLNLVANGSGGFTLTDQNSQAVDFNTSGAFALSTSSTGQQEIVINSTGSLALSGEVTNITAVGSSASTVDGTTLGTLTGIDINSVSGAAWSSTAASGSEVTSVTVKSDGNQGYTFWDQNGNQITATGAINALGFSQATTGTWSTISGSATQSFAVNSTATTQTLDQIDISTLAGANAAIESIDDALTTVDNIQATLGAAQNRFTAISTTQQAQSTDLSQAQSQIQDADFAQETANLSKAQVLQQAGISVLAQANSQPQQILKLLQ